MQNGRLYRSLQVPCTFRSAVSSPAIKKKPNVVHTVSLQFMSELVDSTSGFRLNTFTAIVGLSRFSNSCLKLPASTLVDLTFQSRAPLFQLKSAT